MIDHPPMNEVAQCIAALEHRIAIDNERGAVMQQYREVATEPVDWKQSRYQQECADVPQVPPAFFVGLRNVLIFVGCVALVIWLAMKFGGAR